MHMAIALVTRKFGWMHSWAALSIDHLGRRREGGFIAHGGSEPSQSRQLHGALHPLYHAGVVGASQAHCGTFLYNRPQW